jgi:molybdopterin-guanine dinucleotide biosynthesis adapter protein
MRDLGLDEAIRVAGGVGALARRVGISQPCISNWSRVPAERVVAVEAATGVSRALLRPDLYGEYRSKGDHIRSTRIIGLAGWSGAGKTTLLISVIPRLVVRGLKISTVKHAHHNFDIDKPGKDSHSHRMAGASEVLVGSANRWALVHELRGQTEPGLSELLTKLSPVDLVIIEGYKREPHPKLEVYRAAVGKPLMHPGDPHIVAIATDAPLPSARVPVVSLDDIEGIAELLLKYAVPITTLASPTEGA